MGSPPTALLYCQHSVGLGHLVRSYAIAGALAGRFRVILASGGEQTEALAPPAGVEIVRLPPLAASEHGGLVSRNGISVEIALERRRDLLLERFRRERPELLVVELFPFGRKKFAPELLPLLEEARGKAVVACSLRDLLVTGRRDQAWHDERASLIVNRLFDAVLVHADPRFARLEESFRPLTAIRTPVLYTGFVVPSGKRSASSPSRARRRLVVSAGGGAAGGALLRAAIEAHCLLGPSEGLETTIVAGPFLPEREFVLLRVLAGTAEGIELVRSVSDLGALLAEAAASVSQCGYNTALDLLQAHVPALVVPFAAPGEDEQTRRATRLARLGAVQTLDPARLDGPTLAAEIRRLLRFRPLPVQLDLRGAERTAELLATWVGRRPAAAGAIR